MARIEQGGYTVELVPQGTTQQRFIFNDGEYTVIEDTPNGKVFEGAFYSCSCTGIIVSPEWLSKHPECRRTYPLGYFKLITKRF